MSKKKVLLIGVSVLAAILVIIIIVSFSVSNKKASIPVAKPTPIATTSPVEEQSALLSATNQYKEITESDTQYNQFLLNGTLTKVGYEEAILGVWTVDKYVKGALTNPYFVAGYWDNKDAYAPSAIEKYITPYVSKELNESFLADSKKAADPATHDALASKIFLSDPSLPVSVECYDTWQTENCFAQPQPYIVRDMSYQEQEDGKIRINVTVSIFPLVQTPNTPEGNLSSQERVYNLSFLVAKTNEPASPETKLPVMVIQQIDSSLEIKQLQNYLSNEG